MYSLIGVVGITAQDPVIVRTCWVARVDDTNSYRSTLRPGGVYGSL